MAFHLYSTNIHRVSPNYSFIDPLLACRSFYNAGKTVFEQCFTGHIHVVDQLNSKHIHLHYANLLAKTKTLSITDDNLGCSDTLRFIDPLPNLTRLTLALDPYLQTISIQH